MTKDEAINELKALANMNDTETAHAHADDVLCSLLASLGMQDVVDAYNEVDKWYA